jgi:CRP/FNR family transcriptional regulator, cyclic AMP receptor protein
MSDKTAPSSPETKPVSLESLELFSGVGPEMMKQITQKAQRRTLAKGEVLFSVGDASDALYIITDGRIRIWTVSASGIEVTLNVNTAGAVFGEIGMLDGSERTAGASAMVPTALLSISRRAFFDAMERDSQLARNVIAFLCKRLRWTSARMEDATLRQGPQRLARILGHLASDHSRKTPQGLEITIKLTQGELAQWTAMSRESLNKLLNRWVDDGVIRQEKGILTIRKPDMLEELAEFGD